MKYEIIKGSGKDFEGAPEWATLMTFTGGYYFFVEHERIGSRVLDVARNDEFKSDCDPTGVEIIAERRPIIEPVWDGEGLPPVGALCRYRAFSDMPWVECKVLAWHDDEVWLKRTEDGKTFTLGNPELFPICSPEDVARDEAIEQIISILNEGTSTQDDARDIYDAIAAGKIPGVKLEVQSGN